MNSHFLRGMKYMKHTKTNKKQIPVRKNTVQNSWAETGKYLYESMNQYDKKIRDVKK